MREAFITRGSDGALLIKVLAACQNLERFDELSAEERRSFAVRAIERAGVVTQSVRVRTTDVRTTDRERIGDAAAFADDAAASNPILPGADTERERRREAERNSKLQAEYDEAGKGERHVRE
jgi:hypothetical protein